MLRRIASPWDRDFGIEEGQVLQGIEDDHRLLLDWVVKPVIGTGGDALSPIEAVHPGNVGSTSRGARPKGIYKGEKAMNQSRCHNRTAARPIWMQVGAAALVSLSGSVPLLAKDDADRRDSTHGLEAQVDALQAQAKQLQAQLAVLQTQQANLAVLIQQLQQANTALTNQVNAGDPKLAAISDDGTHSIISRRNVYIQNGTGQTDDTSNGLGNLIVGYDEVTFRTGPCGINTVKMGSHNLVIGPFQSYTSTSALVAGQCNTVSAPDASVTGGSNNYTGGAQSTVSGGINNQAIGPYASVTGGSQNIAQTEAATVSGGLGNIASGLLATVSGGTSNVASGQYATVSAGQGNQATGPDSAVGGGVGLSASSADQFVP